MCPEGWCIPAAWKCNGIPDCAVWTYLSHLPVGRGQLDHSSGRLGRGQLHLRQRLPLRRHMPPGFPALRWAPPVLGWGRRGGLPSQGSHLPSLLSVKGSQIFGFREGVGGWRCGRAEAGWPSAVTTGELPRVTPCAGASVMGENLPIISPSHPQVSLGRRSDWHAVTEREGEGETVALSAPGPALLSRLRSAGICRTGPLAVQCAPAGCGLWNGSPGSHRRFKRIVGGAKRFILD